MTITELILLYLRHLATLGRARLTIRAAKYGLRDFVRFLVEMKVLLLSELSQEIVSEYQQDLAFRLTAKGTPLYASEPGPASGRGQELHPLSERRGLSASRIRARRSACRKNPGDCRR